VEMATIQTYKKVYLAESWLTQAEAVNGRQVEADVTPPPLKRNAATASFSISYALTF